jgi:pimeloyl-ACP methyl ester carboxylesterase
MVYLISCFNNNYGKNMVIFRKILLILSLLYISACSSIWNDKVHFKPQNIKQTQEKKQAGTVVVIHGIARTNKQTYLLANRISQANYEVFNISYPSTDYKIEDLVDYIHNELQKHNIDKKQKVNIVAHSLGGLLTRAYLKKYPMDNLNRVVMIATPNKGSQVADFFKDWGLYKKMFGPAGQQLDTDMSDINKLFGKVDYELGIIAGRTSLNPIFSAMLDGKDDGVVSVESTKLKEMKDHITVSNLHGIQLYTKRDADLVISFLNDGQFDRSIANRTIKYYSGLKIRY